MEPGRTGSAGHLLAYAARTQQPQPAAADPVRCSPNDDQRIPIGALPLGGYNYSGKRGVDDTAAEAAILRRQGIRPVCIFTGSDRELPAARKIYGQAMERIPSVGWFADAVSRLLCRQLRQL